MSVIFYTTHCPKCKVLKAKLDDKNIKYDEIDDIEEMKKLHFTSSPMLQVDGALFDFSGARKLLDKFNDSSSFETFVRSMKVM